MPHYKSIEDFEHPISFQAVDICLRSGDDFILFGKRALPNSMWRFPGGFVDPSDLSLEEAALRELKEETKFDYYDFLAATKSPRYLFSYRVDDARYRDSKHKILTAMILVECKIDAEDLEVQGSDDIASVAWFRLKNLRDLDFLNENVTPAHRELALKVANSLR